MMVMVKGGLMSSGFVSWVRCNSKEVILKNNYSLIFRKCRKSIRNTIFSTTSERSSRIPAGELAMYRAGERERDIYAY